jgi:hypothetical protein
MTTLHDRLAELADDAPPGGPEAGLWDRGRRYHRGRRAGTVVIVAAATIVLAVIAGVTWQRAAPVPAPATGDVGLPDRVWSPSPWLPSTDRPGQLVAIAAVERQTWTGAQPGIVGISATSGEYAFLDLAGVDLEYADAELAPDGRHVAFWLTGTTTGSPLSSSGPVTGLAVYDTASGETTRHWISTAHGLQPEFLAWADADTVAFSAGQIRGGDDASGNDQSSSSSGTVTSWALGDQPGPVAGVERGAYLEGAGNGWLVLGGSASGRGPEHLAVDLDDPGRAHFLDFPRVEVAVGDLHFVALDASGRRIALVPGNRNPHPVHAGPVDHLEKVPDTEGTYGVVDWIDADTIVTLRRLGGAGGGRSAIDRVSLSTGKSRRVVDLPPDAEGTFWQFATDLLSAPSVHADRPPRPADPRAVTGGVVAVLLCGAGALLLWRRRVRP